ncbi:MAG: biotin--[Clostridia bacterium]|nr:biotin--[acetyl-CoA-carboxylase] ligase [Clostridia bacterium]
MDLSKEYIEERLMELPFKIQVEETVSSTNTLMKEYGHNNGEEYSVLIASSQSGGRGRMGRNFYSPKNTGIYMSILLRPKKGTNPLNITTDAAVCCARVFEKMTGKNAEIKWVNDIYMNGKKVCGILTESCLGDKPFAVLGIGVNVLPPKEGFPEDIKNRAGAVFTEDSPFIREEVIIGLLREFFNTYGNPARSLLFEEYKKRSMIIGKDILILRNDGEEGAKAIGINEDYSLIVRKENGEIENVCSGDVSIKL